MAGSVAVNLCPDSMFSLHGFRPGQAQEIRPEILRPLQQVELAPALF